MRPETRRQEYGVAVLALFVIVVMLVAVGVLEQQLGTTSSRAPQPGGQSRAGTATAVSNETPGANATAIFFYQYWSDSEAITGGFPYY